jgi:hypothetical protein
VILHLDSSKLHFLGLQISILKLDRTLLNAKLHFKTYPDLFPDFLPALDMSTFKKVLPDNLSDLPKG